MSDARPPMTPPNEVVTMDIVDRVAVVTISRIERRNALDSAAVESLEHVFGVIADADVLAAVLTGAGGHFCAGADLTSLEDLEFARKLRLMLDRIAGLEVPVIASVEGSCMGLGMQLALACDIRVATHDARFAVPVAKLGLMVDEWTLGRLVAALGWGAARHLLLTAEVLTATDGHRLGFVQQFGDLADALGLAERVARLAPLSVAGSKLGLEMLDARSTGSDERFAELFAAAWGSEDLREGQMAFLERRSPEFRGR